MKKALSVIFLTVLCVLFFGTFCSGYFTDLRTMFSGYGGGLKGLILTVMEKDYLDERLNKDVFRHDNWIDLYGGALRLTGVCSLREDDGKHIVRTAGDRVAFVWAQRRPSAQQTEWIRSLRKAATETGADCWYVSIPQKTCPTETVYCDRGAANHSEETDRAYAAVFEDAGFRVLDLHARMHADGLRHEALYYRTDHHWTDSAAFWAAGVAAQEIGLPTEHGGQASRQTLRRHGRFRAPDSAFCHTPDADKRRRTSARRHVFRRAVLSGVSDARHVQGFHVRRLSRRRQKAGAYPQ